jgi:hypothetical protein
MSTDALRKKVPFFLVGALSVLAVLFLTGAKGMNPVGQYQMEIVVRDRITQIYVMDTTTGVVKWVDDMNKPFAELKGD